MTRINFDNSLGHTHRRPDEHGKWWQTVRVKVSADQKVLRVQPWLYWMGLAGGPDILCGMPVVLSWSGRGNRFERRTIYDERFILVFDYSEEHQSLSVVTDLKYTPYSLWGFLKNIPPGSYLLGIGLEGEEFGKVVQQFYLSWSGNIIDLRLDTV